MLVWLVGCGGGTPGPESDSDADAATDPTSTGFDRVVTTLEVGGRTDGFDLDGDGTADNALWVMKAAIDPLLASTLASSSSELVVQLWGVESLQDDPAVAVGLFAGEVVDGVLDPGVAVDDQGAALISTETAVVGGTYEVVLADQSLTVGGIELAASTPLHASGAPTAAAQTGMLGGAIPITVLIDAVNALGLDPGMLDALAALADIDTDQDGSADAISAAFRFDAVAAP